MVDIRFATAEKRRGKKERRRKKKKEEETTGRKYNGHLENIMACPIRQGGHNKHFIISMHGVF